MNLFAQAVISSSKNIEFRHGQNKDVDWSQFGVSALILYSTYSVLFVGGLCTLVKGHSPFKSMFPLPKHILFIVTIQP